MVNWQIVYTRPAQKDAKKIAQQGCRQKVEEWLAILARNPFQRPPPYEKLIGDLTFDGGLFTAYQSSASSSLSGVGRTKNRQSIANVVTL